MNISRTGPLSQPKAKPPTAPLNKPASGNDLSNSNSGNVGGGSKPTKPTPR